MSGVKQRKVVDYSRRELEKTTIQKNIFANQLKLKEMDNINPIFDNQDICGKLVNNIFKNLKIILCLVYGMTQTGKTGCMTALILYYIMNNTIPIDHIYIITGLSDKEWKKDTKNRMPESINQRVFHRANLNKAFLKDIREKKNVLIIMDEIQIACKEEQTIYKVFKEAKFYDLDYLLDNDIKMVQFSATPDGHINDIADWKHHSEKVKLEPGVNYYGPKEAIQQGRVRQYKCLTNRENVLELKDVVEKFVEPRYHLIRCPNKRETSIGSNNQDKVISNFKSVFGKEYIYNFDYLKVKKGDINDVLKNKPIKETFIFYCEILRCAKTQIKTFIGISYERLSTTTNDSSILQGSFGRLTGYDDNGDSICFTNIPSLENFIKLWDNNMEFVEGIKWDSNTTNFVSIDNLSYSNGTYNSVKHVEQLKDGCSEKVKEERGEPTIQKFHGVKGEQEGMKFFKDNLKVKFGGTGPSKTKLKDSGFYIRPLGRDKDRENVLSTKKMYTHRRWNLDGNSKKKRTQYTWFPCYEDVTDPNTLQWWLIYYE